MIVSKKQVEKIEKTIQDKNNEIDNLKQQLSDKEEYWKNKLLQLEEKQRLCKQEFESDLNDTLNKRYKSIYTQEFNQKNKTLIEENERLKLENEDFRVSLFETKNTFLTFLNHSFRMDKIEQIYFIDVDTTEGHEISVPSIHFMVRVGDELTDNQFFIDPLNYEQIKEDLIDDLPGISYVEKDFNSSQLNRVEILNETIVDNEGNKIRRPIYKMKGNK